MKIFVIFAMYMCYLLPVKPEDKDRNVYCETCLIVAQEIERAVKEASVDSRQTVVETLIGGWVCEKLLSNKHNHVSNNKLKSSCNNLLDVHYDQFHAALVNKELKNLDIVLCYEQSTACVGVKRQSFAGSQTTFSESDIDALVQDSKANVRIAKPMRSSSPSYSREEL